MIERDGRRRALELTQEEAVLQLPVISPDNLDNHNNSTQELLLEIKARRYALFASLINQQFIILENKRSADGMFPPSPYRHRDDDEFGKLRLDYLKGFIETAFTLEDTEEYSALDKLAKIRGQLDPTNGYVWPIGQLAAGSDTAITTTLGLLKNIPGIVRHHAPQENAGAERLAGIANASNNLIWNIAMISINQMMALQATAAGQILHKGWADFNFDMNPDLFKLTRDVDGQVRSIKFNNLRQMVIPSGYRFMEDDAPLSEPTKLDNIPDVGPGVIGCPITLVGERMRQLWEWSIHDVVQTGMWQVKAVMLAAPRLQAYSSIEKP